MTFADEFNDLIKRIQASDESWRLNYRWEQVRAIRDRLSSPFKLRYEPEGLSKLNIPFDMNLNLENVNYDNMLVMAETKFMCIPPSQLPTDWLSLPLMVLWLGGDLEDWDTSFEDLINMGVIQSPVLHQKDLPIGAVIYLGGYFELTLIERITVKRGVTSEIVYPLYEYKRLPLWYETVKE